MSKIIVMLRDPGGAILAEYTSLNLEDLGDAAGLLWGLYAVEGVEPEGVGVRLQLSTGRDVADWEYSAIYDSYETQAIAAATDVSSIEALEADNPTWEVAFCLKSAAELGPRVRNLLELHLQELEAVYSAIEGLENEYSEG